MSASGPVHGPITKRALKRVRPGMHREVADLFGQVEQDPENRQNHPAHAMYAHAHNQLVTLVEELLPLPEMKPFRKHIELAEQEYMPGWPPMSPISKSYFTAWSTYDFPVGSHRETQGQVAIAVATACRVPAEVVALMQALQDSRMGIHRLLAQDGARVRLQELSGGPAVEGECASGYAGRAGELWYARVLPPPAPAAAHVVFTSPYVLRSPDEPAWRAYLERAAATVPGVSREEALAQHFKWGPEARYWPEFIFESYSNHESGAIFLWGLPDVPASRPHSPHFDPGR
jgi:hypothetical protein